MRLVAMLIVNIKYSDVLNSRCYSGNKLLFSAKSTAGPGFAGLRGLVSLDFNLVVYSSTFIFFHEFSSIPCHPA